MPELGTENPTAKESTRLNGDVSGLLHDPALEARTVEATTGTVLAEAGDPARYVYFILSGQVRIYQSGPENSARPLETRLLEILGPGDWFGVPALAGAETYGTRAVAVSAVRVSQVPAENWLALLAQQPGVATQWVARLAEKLVQAREDAACLVFDDCNQRLIKTLLQFSRTAAATPHPEGVVLRITHQQLAQAVGAARETVSRALTQLRQQNLLRTGRNQLIFRPEVLEKFSRRGVADELSGERVA